MGWEGLTKKKVKATPESYRSTSFRGLRCDISYFVTFPLYECTRISEIPVCDLSDSVTCDLCMNISRPRIGMLARIQNRSDPWYTCSTNYHRPRFRPRANIRYFLACAVLHEGRAGIVAEKHAFRGGCASQLRPKLCTKSVSIHNRYTITGGRWRRSQDGRPHELR